ncbi:hypothetical protein FOL47_008786 [Perkinsus chesapeaki]|uniref:Uncharacterized protein n=1 Tax=Perkinsus chesapeaki TaxID=330153 RepID=A0A7J6MTH9_PERCH|nr:hypothetical protein FOL47_008786 [Perkinsus chesapeaki]
MAVALVSFGEWRGIIRVGSREPKMEAMFNMVNMIPKPAIPHLPTIDLHHLPKEHTSTWNADGGIQLPTPVPKPSVGSPYCIPSKIICKLGPAGEILFCAKHCIGRYVYSPKPCHYVMSLSRVCCPGRAMPTRTIRQQSVDFSDYPFKAGEIVFCKDREDVLDADGRVIEMYPARPVVLVKEGHRRANSWEVMFFSPHEKAATEEVPASSLLPYDDGYSKFESVRVCSNPRPGHEKMYMEAVGCQVDTASRVHKHKQPLPAGMQSVLDAAATATSVKAEASSSRTRVRTRSRSSSRRTASVGSPASLKGRARSPGRPAAGSRVQTHAPPLEHPTRHSRRTHENLSPGGFYRATITRMLPESEVYMPEAGSKALPIDSSPSSSSAVEESIKSTTEEVTSSPPPEDVGALQAKEAAQLAQLALYEQADRAYNFLIEGSDPEEFIQRLFESAAFVFGGDESDVNDMGMILAGIRLALKRIEKSEEKFDVANLRRLNLALYQILRPAGFGDLRGAPKLYTCANLLRSIIKDMIADADMG